MSRVRQYCRASSRVSKMLYTTPGVYVCFVCQFPLTFSPTVQRFHETGFTSNSTPMFGMSSIQSTVFVRRAILSKNVSVSTLCLVCRSIWFTGLDALMALTLLAPASSLCAFTTIGMMISAVNIRYFSLPLGIQLVVRLSCFEGTKLNCFAEILLFELLKA